jgi:glycosyltransferase involved in cell wall biosynthesis
MDTKMKIHCHLLTRNEQHILPYSLRHYATFCERIFVHDMGSTDGTLEIAKSFGATSSMTILTRALKTSAG